MALSPGRLKMVSGLCTLAVCGGGAALVVTDPKPVSAPLTPPTGSSTALVIPPSCGAVQIGKGRAKTPPAQPSVAQLSPAAQQAVAAIRAAGSDTTKRRAILAGLSAQDRQMVTAYLRRATQGTPGSAGQCTTTGPQPTAGASIAPSVGTGGNTTPIINTYVS